MVIEKEFQSKFIKEIRLKSGLSQRDFAKKINVSGAYIGQIETGITALSRKTYNKILETFPEYLSNDKVQDNDMISAYFYPDVFGICQNGVFIPSQNRISVKIPKNYFFQIINPDKQYSIIYANGDSMLPNIHNFDRLIVEHMTENEQIKDNHVYVFCYKNKIFTKRLIYNIDEIIIISDNSDPIYKTKTIQKCNDISILGQIVGIARDLKY